MYRLHLDEYNTLYIYILNVIKILLVILSKSVELKY